jgi:hypothetical protein
VVGNSNRRSQSKQEAAAARRDDCAAPDEGGVRPTAADPPEQCLETQALDAHACIWRMRGKRTEILVAKKKKKKKMN